MYYNQHSCFALIYLPVLGSLLPYNEVLDYAEIVKYRYREQNASNHNLKTLFGSKVIKYPFCIFM
jgi:hypothetical protein